MLAYMDDLLICKLITGIAAIPVALRLQLSRTTQYRTVFSSPCQFVSARSNRFAALSTRCLPPMHSPPLGSVGLEESDPNNPSPSRSFANTDSNGMRECAFQIRGDGRGIYCKRADIISQRLRWKISIAGLRSLAAIKTGEK